MEADGCPGDRDECRIALPVPQRAHCEPAIPAGDPCTTPCDADIAPLRHLRQYLAILGARGVGADPVLRALVARTVADLLVLAFDARATAADRPGDVRAARLRAIKTDIAKSIDGGRLSVNSIASRHRVTPRYVQMLFAAEGTTFTQFVLESRLACAYRMLADPRFANRRVATVAFDAGFGDLSYFNRCFRRRFGVAPSQVRTEARRNNNDDGPWQSGLVVGAPAQARMHDVGDVAWQS